MSAIEKWTGRKPEPTATELIWERQRTGSLNNRVDGWHAVERLEIGAVVAHMAMQSGARVFTEAAYWETRVPEAGDFFRDTAETWGIGARGELAGFFQRRLQ